MYRDRHEVSVWNTDSSRSIQAQIFESKASIQTLEETQTYVLATGIEVQFSVSSSRLFMPSINSETDT